MRYQSANISFWRQSALLYFIVSLMVAAGVFGLQRATQQAVDAGERSKRNHDQVARLKHEMRAAGDSAQQYTRLRRQADLQAWLDSTYHTDITKHFSRRLAVKGPTEAALVKEVARLADDLRTTEARAMRLAATAGQTSYTLLPKELSEANLTEQDLKSTQKLMYARRLLNSVAYNDAFRVLDEKINELSQASDARIREEVKSAESNRNAAGLLLIGVAVLVPVLLFLDALRRRLAERRLRAYVDLGERLSGVSTAYVAAKLILDAADSLIGWDAAYLGLTDPAKPQQLDFILSFDLVDGKRVAAGTQVRTGGKYSTQVVTEKRGVLVLRSRHELREDAQMAFGDQSRPSASLMFVPVRSGGEVIGVLSLQSYTLQKYDKGDLETLQWLADRCAAGLGRANLYEKVRQSEEKYRALLENSLDGIYLMQDGRFLYCNAAMASLFGYSAPQELLANATVTDLIAPESREAAQENLHARLAGETFSEPHRFRAMRKDGAEMVCEVQGTRIQLDGRQALLGTIRDVSARDRAEQAVQQTHAIYQSAIEAVGAIPYTYDYGTGEYTFLGADIEDVTGFTPEDFNNGILPTRIRFKQFHDGLDAVPTEERLRRAKAGDLSNMRVDFLFERKDGRQIWLTDASIPRRGPDGRVVGSLGIMMDITERKRAEVRAQAFASLGERMSGVTSPTEAAQVIHEAADKLFAFDVSHITMYDSNTNTISSLLMQDVVDGQRVDVTAQASPGIPTFFARKVLSEGSQLVLRTPTDNGPQLQGIGTGRPSASLMFAPMRRSQGAIGYISIQSYTHNAYSEHDLSDLQALADHCASGLERAQLYSLLHSNEERFRAVWENAGSGMRVTDSEGIIRMVNPSFCQLVGKSMEELVGQPLSVYYSDANDEHIVESYKSRFRNHSVADHLERTMELWDRRTLTMRISNTFIHTPDGEMLLGIFHDLTTQKALENELRANATKMTELAITDALTGLHTRRSLMDEFLKEFARAQRYGSPLSVLMLDLDHFKTVNDSYGHMIGDVVLSKVGQLIRESLRFTDIAGRYGGEEFCVFMPETDLDGAHIFAERLRQQISMQTYKSNDGVIFPVTCSIGLAQLNEDFEDPIDFLSAVDRALYRAKGQGRDRVCVG